MKNDQPIYTTAKPIEYPRKSLMCRNEKSVRAYDNILMTSQTSSLNIAIKNGKQANN